MGKQSDNKSYNDSKINKEVTILFFAVVVIAIFMGTYIYINSKERFNSASDMKSQMQGTYTYYIGDDPQRQIVIENDTMNYVSLSGDTWYEDISEWLPSEGEIYTYRTYYVTTSGDIKDGSDLYKKGGIMCTYTPTPSPTIVPTSAPKAIEDPDKNKSYSELTTSDKKEICEFIQGWYDYYDRREGKYTGDQYTDEVFQLAVERYGLTEEQLVYIWGYSYEY